MSLFQKLISIPPLQPFFQLEDPAFIDDPGWRDVLSKVKQLREMETLLKVIREAVPVREKDKIILGYMCTMAAEMASGPVELPCVDYGGCYMNRGVLHLTNPSDEYVANNVGMGMNASNPEIKILIEGNVGDFLGYRAPQLNMEVKGSARDRAAMAVGGGSLKIEGDVAGALGGNSHDTRMEVDGSVGRVHKDNFGCKISIGGDIHWGISEHQSDCFIKVCGSVGVKAKKSGKMQDVAAGLCKNAALLVGGDVYGHLGKKMELAKVYVWGRVYGEIHSSDAQGGFIYLNKKSTPFLERMKKSIGGAIGVKYVALKESGYLFAEEPEDLKEMIVG
jgi:formylmethanofuran dehydrogenase subunit C